MGNMNERRRGFDPPDEFKTMDNAMSCPSYGARTKHQ